MRPGTPLAIKAEVSQFVDHLVGAWRSNGATNAQIGDELDMRILKCGQEILKAYIRNPNEFTLSEFNYTTLRYCYPIFHRNKHLPKITEEMYVDYRPEIIKWKLTCNKPTKSGLIMCVMVLAILAEIQLSGKPFVVK